MPNTDCLTICFTGRRPKDLVGYDKNNYQDFVKDLEARLKVFCEDTDKPVRFISGGAQGFDQLAFWAVDLLKQHNSGTRLGDRITNVVYVPFKGQERIWPKESLFGRDDFNKMLRRADSVVYLRDEIPGATNKPTPSSAKYAINNALLSRNHRMVDDSDFVIALYPTDDWRESSGGTAECMRYAKRAGKDIYQYKYAVNDGKLVISETLAIIGTHELENELSNPGLTDDDFVSVI